MKILDKPVYTSIIDFKINGHYIAKGELYSFNGLAYSPETYDAIKNGGYTISEDIVKDKRLFREYNPQKKINMTREETVVLTTLYNMLSGHFKTNKKAILTCFDPSKHQEVINALLSLRSKRIVYIDEYPFGWNHCIDWDIFKEEMIDQELRNKGL